ncbi:MDR family MFS transporter [Fictibacillus phosphorivorans]|uniref:MDR family MFS transporter n=1 Tax=Fictibacillus phosphorivorans TaxID=1221500 RepID=UPI002041BA6B|nr:MDR family MFS transporter [Fictibacillus phosphorivorans]MCM3719049.1 MFS transporter [Fictibacillus phosphorivorans]MCM3776671.1 MFS transporter [Fictibacillus phosphorivorans]
MVHKESNIKLVVAGLLLGILMAAMDNTIVATAMGTIVADLGGFDKFVWVTGAYMVAVMAGMPIYGKLSDMYGRKRFFIFGLILFLVGSMLCGLAQSMEQLIAFRAIQGIGGGALMPIAFTIVFDIFPPEKRGKMTGLLGAVFGTSSVLGPLLGAFITDAISWHWVFYINVPIGAASLYLIYRYYSETLEHREQKIDWWGAITLVAAVVSLMIALELGGKTYPWDSTPIVALFTTFTVFFIVFFVVEQKAAEPIISFWMFKRRLFATSQILGFLYGGTFIILAVFIPIFVQAVYGGSATSAGMILTPMMLGSVAGSMVGGIFQTKTTFRNLMIVSVITYFIGMYLLSGITPDTTRLTLTLFMILVGFGMGFSFSLLPTATINGMEFRYRGSANSTNAFLRSLGMTIGVTIFGALQNRIFYDRLSENLQGKGEAAKGAFTNIDPQKVFQPEERAKIPNEILESITASVSDSISTVFMYALIPIGISAVVVFMMGNERVISSEKVEGKAE